jgi:hypothetical protein
MLHTTTKSGLHAFVADQVIARYLVHGAYEDFVLNAYLWLLLGVLFRLPDIKVSAELEAAQLASARHRRHWIL